MNKNLIDLKGLQIGSWVVQKRIYNDGPYPQWEVMCKRCFSLFTKKGRDLRRRKRKPYGCIQCTGGRIK